MVLFCSPMICRIINHLALLNSGGDDHLLNLVSTLISCPHHRSLLLDQCLPWLRETTGATLDGDIDMTASKYDYTGKQLDTMGHSLGITLEHASSVFGDSLTHLST